MGNGKNSRRQRMTKAPVKGAQKNTLKQQPLVVALQLRFIDPEGTIRVFPKDFEVEVKYGNNQKSEIRKIDNDLGNLIFPLSRADASQYKFFRLHFACTGNYNHIICEKKGDEKKTTLGNRPVTDEKAKAGHRFFRLPPHWSFLTSDWVVSLGAPPPTTPPPTTPPPTTGEAEKKSEIDKLYDKAEKQKKFLITEGGVAGGKPQGIGTRENPVKTLLNPHWLYLKFEYFDRFYGHTDHDNKPVSIPQVTVEGFRKGKPGGGGDNPDTRSNWRIAVDDDEKKAVQCLPWILQAKDDGTAEQKPDKDSQLQVKQPKDTYIISKSATERKIKSLVAPMEKADIDALKPCADRLKYYDLPETWLSQKYFCRLSEDKQEQGFFESMAYQKTMLQKPLIFSLDDIVLTDDKIAPLSMRETDKVVLFYHEFLDAAGDANRRGDGGRAGATYWKNGLYRPGLDLVAGKAAASKSAKDAKKADLDAGVLTVETKAEVEERTIGEEFARLGGGNDVAIKAAGDQAVIDLAGKNAAIKADAPLQAKLKAEAKQKAIEEKAIRDPAEANRRKKEEDTARQAAQDAVTDSGGSNAAAVKAGNKAVADLAKDAEAQKRIKDAGDKAVTGNLPKNVAAQKRITTAGEEAAEAARAFPYSDVPRHEEVPNYISDYPHWTRLVIANGNLFDVFDKRTTSGDVIGARAGVRWVDITSSGIGVAAGAEIAPRPAATPAKAKQDEAYFIVQPYYEQKSIARSYDGSPEYERDQGFYDEWGSPIAEGEAKVSTIGRNVVAILRTSNYKVASEENVLFLYYPFSFDFTSEESLLNPSGAAPPDIEDKRIQWLTTLTKTCADRWNGNDTVNDSRAWIVEDKATDPKLRTQVVSFIQRLDKPNAHIHIKTVAESKTSFVSSYDGTGEFRVKAGADTTGEPSDRGFAAAHELGHAGGQPDDYAPSVKGQIGFGSNNTLGAPYVLDERAMMKFNRQLRARSYWYLAEWMRSLNPFKDTKFQVEHNSNKYKVPHYNHADRTGRNYAHWAVKAQIFHTPSDPQYYDALLYFLGKDEYTQTVLPSQPDGIIVVMVKTLFEFTGYINEDALIEHVFSQLNQKLNAAFNATRVHARFALPGITHGTPDTFMKCMLHFSPRFEVTAGLPSHLEFKIKSPAGPVAAKNWYYKDGANNLGPFGEIEMHARLDADTVKSNTRVIARTGATWEPPWRDAKDVPEFEANFVGTVSPRTLDFYFPLVSSQADLNTVMTRLENVYLKHVCQMLGLSVVSTDANYYQNADAYKELVKACVNDAALNPTMSRA